MEYNQLLRGEDCARFDIALLRHYPFNAPVDLPTAERAQMAYHKAKAIATSLGEFLCGLPEDLNLMVFSEKVLRLRISHNSVLGSGRCMVTE